MPRTMASKREERRKAREKRKLEIQNEQECPPRKRRRVKAVYPVSSDDEEYAIERIADSRTYRGNQEYLIVWVGYPGEDTWETVENLPNELIEEYRAGATSQKASDSKVAGVSCICKSNDPRKATIQCELCEKWLHFSCVGLKRAPPKEESWFCPTCVEKRNGERDVEMTEEKESESESPLQEITKKTVNRRTCRTKKSKMTETPRSPSIEWDSDFEGDISSEEDDEGKDENYDPETEVAIQCAQEDEEDDSEEDFEMCEPLGDKNDCLRSDSESAEPTRRTRSRSAKSPSSSGSPVVLPPKPHPVMRKKVVRRVNPQKMELDLSDDSDFAVGDEQSDSGSDSSVEVLPSERKKRKRGRNAKDATRPPIGLRGLEHKWLMSLKWREIENTERDHDAPDLPAFGDYSNGYVLPETGEVDEKNCAIFNYDPHKHRDTVRSRLHVWRSPDAKRDYELKRDEPLGNFRADYNGTESTSVRRYWGKEYTAVVTVNIVSQIRFNAAGTPCIRVTADWSWDKHMKSKLESCRKRIVSSQASLAKEQAELEDFKRHPSYPFTSSLPNPDYDAVRADKWLARQPPYVLHQRWRQPTFVPKTFPNPKYDQCLKTKRMIRIRTNEIEGARESIKQYEKEIALCWKPLLVNLDSWIPVSQDAEKSNKRADLSAYIYTGRSTISSHASSTGMMARGYRNRNRNEITRQERLDLIEKSVSNKAAARKLAEITALEDYLQGQQSKKAKSSKELNDQLHERGKNYLFIEKIHNVCVTLMAIMNDVQPQIPDVIVTIISTYTEDDMCVKDIEISPSVLLKKLRASGGRFSTAVKFLIPYVLETNSPSREVTLVENREQLFYQSSNVPSIALNLIENLDERALRDVSQTDLRGIGTKLFKYQLRSYVWMENLEQKVLRKHRWHFGCNDMYIDSQTASFDGESTAFPIVCDHVEQEVSIFEVGTARKERFLTVSGGVLADEVGLGKTLTTICVMFGNRPTLSVIRSLNCVKTTLIIAPSHLLHQWKEEMEKHVKRDWDIFEVPTKRQFMKVTPQRLYCADVLLVSTQFLKGKFYNTYRGTNKPWLETVKFWRCIVDEGHELVENGNSKAKMNALNMNAVHYWYLSGTPFPSPQALAFCCEFIRLRVCDRPVIETQFLLRSAVGKVIEKLLVDHIVMRNTKVSVDELYIPKRVETPAFVKLHPVELGFYKICRDLFPQDARQICTDIASVDPYRISSIGPDLLQQMASAGNLSCGLNVLPTRVAFNRREQLPRQRSAVTLLQFEIRAEERKTVPDKMFLRAKKRDLAKEKKKLTRIEREIKFCESSELRTSLEVWKIANRANPLRYATLLLGSKFSKAVLWISNLVKSDPNVRIIAFSNFNKVLRNYHKYLSEVMKVKTVFCMGNVYVRRRAMQSFQSDDRDPVRVILLSIQKSASGANLTRATHVCLLDPVAASASQAVASEEQAVGRALRQGMSSERHCQIIRFVAKGTIEQELFERNQEQRQQNEGDADDAL